MMKWWIDDSANWVALRATWDRCPRLRAVAWWALGVFLWLGLCSMAGGVG